MYQSETIGKLAEALAKAQGEMRHAVKDTENPFLNKKYADLAAVWEACRQPLASHGLAVAQTVGYTEDGTPTVTTILMHTSGEWVSDECAMKPVKNDPQGIGSCITYMRRYSLAAMVGVYQDDDDGNAASDPSGKQKPKKAEEEVKPDVSEWRRELNDRVKTVRQLAGVTTADAMKRIKAKTGKTHAELTDAELESFADEWANELRDESLRGLDTEIIQTLAKLDADFAFLKGVIAAEFNGSWYYDLHPSDLAKLPGLLEQHKALGGTADV